MARQKTNPYDGGPRMFPRQTRMMTTGFDSGERVRSKVAIDWDLYASDLVVRKLYEVCSERAVARGTDGVVMREVSHPCWGHCVLVRFQRERFGGNVPPSYVYMKPDELESLERDR